MAFNTIREELLQLLSILREEYSEVAFRIWDLFKRVKSPEKVVEKVIVKNVDKERDLKADIERIQAQLKQKDFAVKQLEQKIKEINQEWEDRFTVVIDNPQLSNYHSNWLANASDEKLLRQHKENIDLLIDRLPIKGLKNISFAKKQMLLHFGFSECILLKMLASKTWLEARKMVFPFKIVKKYDGESK